MSAPKGILIVFGATGTQGGSVIQAILDDPVAAAHTHIHAITRDPTKPAAIALAKKGVTVLKADLDDKISLRAAMKGAYAVFSVTNFHELMSKERESQQGKNVADIAKEFNVQHLVWSSAVNVSMITNNVLTKVLHFDSKALVEDYICSLGIPATFLQLGIYMHQISYNLHPTTTSSADKKSYRLLFPVPSTTLLPLISVNPSIGIYVKSILSQKDKSLGTQICAAQDWYSLDDIVRILKEEGGLDVVFEQCSDAEYRAGLVGRGLPDFFVDDMSESARFIAEWGFYGGKEGALEGGHQIITEPLETFKEFVKAGGTDHLRGTPRGSET